MSHISSRLGLPYMQPAQAQKHVTHNEALRILDQVTQLVVVRFDAQTPPPAPQDGQGYALGTAPTGDWAGQGGMLAFRADGVWLFLAPQDGWRAWGLEEAETRIYRAGGWTGVGRLGIGATADDTNRLAVSGAGTLLTHAGAGHRLTVNKAGPEETASLLFQSGWTGHAEMGLAGDNAFSVKLSPDGATWQEVMRADPAAQTIGWSLAGQERMRLEETGLQLEVPVTGPAVQAGPEDITPGRLMRADYGYGPGNLLGPVSQAAGVPTGGVIERGSNASGEYLRLADGTQICWKHFLTSEANAEKTWAYPAAFVNGEVSISVVCTSPSPRFATVPSVSETACGIRTFDMTGDESVVPNVRVTAIGRWI